MSLDELQTEWASGVPLGLPSYLAPIQSNPGKHKTINNVSPIFIYCVALLIAGADKMKIEPK